MNGDNQHWDVMSCVACLSATTQLIEKGILAPRPFLTSLWWGMAILWMVVGFIFLKRLYKM